MVDQYKQQVDGIMQREVSRGEFLTYVGVAMLSLVGVFGFIKNLHDIVPAHPNNKQIAAGGYGRSPYGR